MFKETLICIAIVISIFVVDMFTQNFTKNTVNEVTDIFSDLKSNILNEDETQINNEIKRLDEKWKNVHDKLL